MVLQQLSQNSQLKYIKNYQLITSRINCSTEMVGNMMTSILLIRTEVQLSTIQINSLIQTQREMDISFDCKIQHGISIIYELEQTQGTNEESPVVQYFPPSSKFGINEWRQIRDQSTDSITDKNKMLQQTKCNIDISKNQTILCKTCPTPHIQNHYDSLLYLPPKQYGFKTDRSRIICGDRSLIFYVDCSMKQLQSKVSQLKNQKQPRLKKNSHIKKGIAVTCRSRQIRA